ncbi:RES domain-containing protein [Paraburkholderia phenoliruptrix]|uniref:RES domain-containing protein n=1 Tax=Paraburkholderia phenoliruptrix BR3459a TaxID=1229205 RepID=K0DZB0_9BURK|nr:hypothetical protein BUPH_08440 [Paraburkholderia phenoliruptrix BR3459a]
MGGRANRVGLNALYLALDVDTAAREYQQISPLMPPGTLVSCQLTVDPIVDLTAGIRAGNGLPCGKISIATGVAAGSTSASNRPVGLSVTRLLRLGRKGFSHALSQDGVNLVLYVDELEPTDRLDVYDPQRSLPQNQSSWT